MTDSDAQAELIAIGLKLVDANLTETQRQKLSRFALEIAVLRAGGPAPNVSLPSSATYPFGTGTPAMPQTYTNAAYPAGYAGAPSASTTFTTGAAIVYQAYNASNGAPGSTTLWAAVAPVGPSGTPGYNQGLALFRSIPEATLSTTLYADGSDDASTLAALITASAAFRASLP